ncbi:MAG: helix-turn-helix domain-containing protein [Desulfobacteraceae bacterium]|nr:helix-turn-helix domain-containing protein [Desulfobacteraceae bacterium]
MMSKNFRILLLVQISCRKFFKYRLYFQKSQIPALENQFSMYLHLYNWNLQERIESCYKEGLSVTSNQQHSQSRHQHCDAL